MALFWYPEINDSIDLDNGPDKAVLLSSYIRYFLARLQSMFIYEDLPDSIPAKWLENYLLVNGTACFIECDKGLIVTRCGMGGMPDEYYVPTECIVTNPYIAPEYNKTYKRDVDCVLIYNDTYAQGLLPLLKKYCYMLVENEITMNLADILARASIIMSAADDTTRASAEMWLSRLKEGHLGIIGETPFLVANQDKSLNTTEFQHVAETLTDLIEYQQYIKASLYNEIGLDSNYNMKRESINSGESQLNDDMLHPLIDDMLRERQIGIDKVNKMFGTDIKVRFNSAWAVNEIEEQAAAINMLNGDENGEVYPDVDNNDSAIDNSDDNGISANEVETPEEPIKDTPEVEITISENAIEEIADKVAEKLEEDDTKDGEDNAENNA